MRWVTNAGCDLVVSHVQLSQTGDDSLGNTATEIAALGFDRADRKYIVWVDANVYCGMGEWFADDAPGPENWHNGHPRMPGMVSRIDQ